MVNTVTHPAVCRLNSGHASRIIRAAFARHSTGTGQNRRFYDCKENAFRTFDAELREFGLCLDSAQLSACSGPVGCRTVSVFDANSTWSGEVGRAEFTWSEKESGQYDFAGRLN